jgi:hypothetical protein
MKCVWIALAATRLAMAADLSVQEYLPPDTKVVMGLRVSALRDSDLFQQTSDDAKGLKESWTKISKLAGFDPLHDIDEVVLTSPADRENAPVLLVVRGRFNLDKLSAGAERYRDVPIIGVHDKSANGVVALLDSSTALVGEVPTVRAAINRRGKPAAYDRELLARVMSLRERFDVWGTGDRPEGFVSPGGQKDQLESIDHFEFGLRITHGLELNGELHARSQKDVDQLMASMALLQMMAKAQSDAARFDVKAENGTVRLSLAIAEEDLKKAIAAHKNAGTPFKEVKKVQPGITTTPGGTSVLTLPGSGR